jgi:hypothetical protein
VRYLHRHPSEVSLSIDQIAEVAYIAREIEKNEADNSGAILKALLGTRL